MDGTRSLNADSQIHLSWNGYLITTDKTLMHPEHVHEWLAGDSYWAKYIPWEVFERAFDNSFCIGAIDTATERQVGFARLITDHATYAYLADVWVDSTYRGRGISKVMMKELFDLDWVKSLRRIMLATKDAHGLYAQVGFKPSNFPDRIMEIARPNIYGDMETRC